MITKLKTILHVVLAKASHYTKTDLHYFARGGFWLVFRHIIIIGLGFGLTIGYARLLPKETYGLYKYILSLGVIFNALTLSGITSAVLQAVAKGKEGVLTYAYWKNIQWSIFSMIIAVGVGIYYFIQGNSTLATAIILMGIINPFINSASIFSAFLQGKRNFKAVGLYDIYANVFNNATLFISIIVTKNVLYILLTNFVGMLVSSTFLFLTTLAKYKKNKENDPEIVNYGKHLSLMNIVSIVADNLDNVLVFHYAGAASLAIYSFATIMPDQLRSIVKNIYTLVYPKLAVKDKEEAKKSIKQRMPYLWMALALVALAYIILSPLVFKFIFPSYIESLRYSQLYVISMLATISLPSIYLETQKAVKEQYIIIVTSNVLRVILMFALVLKFGIWGMVLGKIIPKFIGNYLAYALLKRY